MSALRVGPTPEPRAPSATGHRSSRWIRWPRWSGWSYWLGWLRRLARALLFTLMALALLAGGGWFAYYHRPLPSPSSERLFQGVTYTREVRRAPRPAVIHVVTVDTEAPGIGFLVTPGDASDPRPLAARTTSDFLREFHVQVAINGDFFSPWYSDGPLDFYPHRGDRVSVDGYACSGGVAYSPGKSLSERTLRFSRDHRPSFSLPLAEAEHAISGEPLVDHGAPALDSYHDPNGRQPRTAVGLDREERRLFLIVVDGRQPNYSEGVSLTDLAEIAVRAGAYTALNLDGGGSSTLVVESSPGGSSLLSSPIHTRIPWRERPVGNHLGVFARRE